MEIELLYFDGCSSHAAFEQRLRELFAEAGLDVQIRQRRVECDAVAFEAPDLVLADPQPALLRNRR
jgi:hypothetical protein